MEGREAERRCWGWWEGATQKDSDRPTSQSELPYSTPLCTRFVCSLSTPSRPPYVFRPSWANYLRPCSQPFLYLLVLSVANFVHVSQIRNPGSELGYSGPLAMSTHNIPAFDHALGRPIESRLQAMPLSCPFISYSAAAWVLHTPPADSSRNKAPLAFSRTLRPTGFLSLKGRQLAVALILYQSEHFQDT